MRLVRRPRFPCSHPFCLCSVHTCVCSWDWLCVSIHIVSKKRELLLPVHKQLTAVGMLSIVHASTQIALRGPDLGLIEPFMAD